MDLAGVGQAGVGTIGRRAVAHVARVQPAGAMRARQYFQGAVVDRDRVEMDAGRHHPFQ